MKKKRKIALSSKDAESRVIAALSNGRFKYRTVSGLALDSRLDAATVMKILEGNPVVRVSIAKAKDGSPLYAHKEKVSAVGDLWTAFRALNSAKYGS